MTINRTAMLDYVDAVIGRTENPKHVAQLQVLRKHMNGEITEDVDSLLETISPKKQQYRTWGAGAHYEPDSLDRIREFYYERKAQGQLYFQFDIDRLTVADDILITDGEMTSLVPGSMAQYFGVTDPDTSAVYKATTRMCISWPFDETGLLIGEESYSVPLSIEKIDDSEVPEGFLQSMAG